MIILMRRVVGKCVFRVCTQGNHEGNENGNVFNFEAFTLLYSKLQAADEHTLLHLHRAFIIILSMGVNMDNIGWLEEVIRREDKCRTIDRVLKMVVRPAAPEGESFVSDAMRVTLEVVLHSGKKCMKSFVVKFAKNTEYVARLNREMRVYHREIFCFVNILKNMEEIMESHQDHRGIMWPRFIGCSNDNIVLEDLKTEGYNSLLRTELMDLEMSMLVIDKLARFHAMGLVLLENGTVRAMDCFDSYFSHEEMTRVDNIELLRDLGEIIRTSWSPEWKDLGDKIIALTYNGSEMLKKENQADESVFNVINHGDCRTSNIMVKQDSQGNISDVKILDFQLINFNSFAYDFHYFTIFSIIPEVRRKHIGTILKTYYASLIGTLSIYNYNLTKIPSLYELTKELNRMSFTALMLIPLVGGFVSDILNSFTAEREVKSSIVDLRVFKSGKFRDWFASDIKNLVESCSRNKQ